MGGGLGGEKGGRTAPKSRIRHLEKRSLGSGGFAASFGYAAKQAAVKVPANSRIYWSGIQEGLSACAGATYLDFHDCAIFALSAVCQPENCEACVEALQAEALKITREGAREPEVQRVRNKRRTGLAVEGEAPYHRFVQLVDDIDYHGAPRTVEERLGAVDAVTPQTLGEYLEAFPITEKGLFVSVGPRNWPEL